MKWVKSLVPLGRAGRGSAGHLAGYQEGLRVPMACPCTVGWWAGGGLTSPGMTPFISPRLKSCLRQGDFGTVAERERGDAGGSRGSIPGTGSPVMPAACLHFARALGGGGQAIICVYCASSPGLRPALLHSSAFFLLLFSSKQPALYQQEVEE